MIETLRPDWPHRQHVLVVDGKPGQGTWSWEVFRPRRGRHAATLTT